MNFSSLFPYCRQLDDGGVQFTHDYLIAGDNALYCQAQMLGIVTHIHKPGELLTDYYRLDNFLFILKGDNHHLGPTQDEVDDYAYWIRDLKGVKLIVPTTLLGDTN